MRLHRDFQSCNSPLRLRVPRRCKMRVLKAGNYDKCIIENRRELVMQNIHTATNTRIIEFNKFLKSCCASCKNILKQKSRISNRLSNRQTSPSIALAQAEEEITFQLKEISRLLQCNR